MKLFDCKWIRLSCLNAKWVKLLKTVPKNLKSIRLHETVLVFFMHSAIYLLYNNIFFHTMKADLQATLIGNKREGRKILNELYLIYTTHPINYELFWTESASKDVREWKGKCKSLWSKLNPLNFIINCV